MQKKHEHTNISDYMVKGLNNILVIYLNKNPNTIVLGTQRCKNVVDSTRHLHLFEHLHHRYLNISKTAHTFSCA